MSEVHVNHLTIQLYVYALVGLGLLIILFALVRAISMADTIELNLGFAKLTLRKLRRSKRR